MMEELGLPKSKVLHELKAKLRRDLTFKSGRILDSMCTNPHIFAKQIYSKLLEKNLGDPTLFPGVGQLEREAVNMIGSLLSNPYASGHIVSGGSEANLLALWAARKLSGDGRREVLLPASAHISFDRAADLLSLKLKRIKLNPNYQVNVEQLRRSISRRTLAIVGVAGSTEIGAVDPIEELSEVASAHNIYLHVDAAFGGFVIPFLKELGYRLPEFDFKLKGVSSITIDPHKMGLSPIPAGGILFRDETFLHALKHRIPYVTGGESEYTTISLTRPGASAAAVWVLLKHLGRIGYRHVVGRCMKLTLKLADYVSSIDGVDVVTPPVMNIIGIKSDDLDIDQITQILIRRGWAVSVLPSYMRLVVMPHVKQSHIKAFSEDLKLAVREATTIR